MKTTSAEHGQNRTFHGNSMNNILSYFGLVDARISASEKDLPVTRSITKGHRSKQQIHIFKSIVKI